MIAARGLPAGRGLSPVDRGTPRGWFAQVCYLSGTKRDIVVLGKGESILLANHKRFLM